MKLKLSLLVFALFCIGIFSHAQEKPKVPASPPKVQNGADAIPVTVTSTKKPQKPPPPPPPKPSKSEEARSTPPKIEKVEKLPPPPPPPPPPAKPKKEKQEDERNEAGLLRQYQIEKEKNQLLHPKLA
ncbi:MAG: hypothetical protein RLZZ28_551 [Bacteroidota bacterium]